MYQYRGQRTSQMHEVVAYSDIFILHIQTKSNFKEFLDFRQVFEKKTQNINYQNQIFLFSPIADIKIPSVLKNHVVPLRTQTHTWNKMKEKSLMPC